MSLSDKLWDHERQRHIEKGEYLREYVLNFVIDEYLHVKGDNELSVEEMVKYQGRIEAGVIFVNYMKILEATTRERPSPEQEKYEDKMGYDDE